MPLILQIRSFLPYGWYKAAFFCSLFCISIPAAADILRFPGQAPTIQETIDRARDGDTMIIKSCKQGYIQADEH